MGTPGEHSDLFMHPQSCIIEELDAGEDEPAASSSSQAGADAAGPAHGTHASAGNAARADAPATATATAATAAAAAAAGGGITQEASSGRCEAAGADAAAGSSQQAQDSAAAAAAGAEGAVDAAGSSSSAAAEQQQLDPEATQQLLEECECLKQQGNAAYAQGDYDEALQLYWQAIDQAPEFAQQRAVYFCNAAACYIKKELWQLAAEQCTHALKLDEGYIKALMRRSQALQQLDDLEHALADAQRVLELDPSSVWAPKVIAELTPEVQQRQEKLKEEMLGKLKDLGNSLLGKFGLSLDNFKAEQDPNTGGYSIKFAQ